jgi:hypothetical protein
MKVLRPIRSLSKKLPDIVVSPKYNPAAMTNSLEVSDLSLPQKLGHPLNRVQVAMRADSWEAFGFEQVIVCLSRSYNIAELMVFS